MHKERIKEAQREREADGQRENKRQIGHRERNRETDAQRMKEEIRGTEGE